ncbi:hypothetical protein VHUM_00372 [Vanrija humicola]|uniref:N-acetyltransferase domain-containing protein n=1 Tax=Vanrija humicola TaxID=5417 RepID=A0A7D8V5J2_VANHU|nr:hypothetical protein VHUM_00372 [Vanrija humicola]
MSSSIKTARFTISPLTAADREAFTAYRATEETARYQGWEATYSLEDADGLIAGQPESFPPPEDGWLQLAIHDESGALVGDVAVHTTTQPDTYELGVTVAPSHQRKGVAREALGAVVDALFGEHKAHRVTAETDARNDAVGELLKSLGFTHEGRAREADFFKGEWVSLDSWAILASDRR